MLVLFVISNVILLGQRTHSPRSNPVKFVETLFFVAEHMVNASALENQMSFCW